MTLLAHDRLAVFSFPRAATKLIANALTQSGYHNYGEWYDVWSSSIQDDHAVRMSQEQIKARLDLLSEQTRPMDIYMAAQTATRSLQFDKHPRSVVTVWFENAISFPLLFLNMKDHHWICPKRDAWQQLTSFVVSWHNNNFNAQWTSEPVTVDLKWFETFYWRWHHVRVLQEWLVNSGRGTFLDFDSVVSGGCTQLGDYTVTTADEHVCPENLILNLHEVQSRYTYLEAQRINFGQVVLDNINKLA